jgi:outer membrane protein OmpA-like peptidoglycan-associated protein
LPDAATATDSAIVDYWFFISRVGLTYALGDFAEISGSLDIRNWIRNTQEQPASGTLDTATRGGLGDTDVSLKLSAPLPTKFLKVGALGTFSFPTGSKDRRFTTESTDILALGLLTLDFTNVEKFVPTRLHVNAGYRWNRNENFGYGITDFQDPDSSGFNPPGYPETPIGESKNYNDNFVFASAVEFPAPQVTFFVDFFWEKLLNVDIDAINSAREAASLVPVSENYLVLSPGIEFTSESGAALKLGADINLNKGDRPSLINPPDWGLWLAFTYGAEIVPRDTDGDGIKDKTDACPNEPEDFDGFEDDDGCPDLDNDGDGIPDASDACPDLPEDFDGFEDSDGCPDLDNDQDGIPDAQDACPDEPEDFDGVEDTDGCPDLVKDSDNDGIPDDTDRCPLQAEDIDGFQDDDGCPDLDNDLDGIPDEVDNCPNSPETFNGFQDEDGCPDERPIQERFVLKGVHFESGSAALTPDSYSVLDDVVRSLQAYPEVRIEIRGHTDSQGPASFNLELSQRRAESVRQYMVNSGIDPSRVVAIGVGEEEPISSNASADGRAQNRRIEFRRLNQ